ncbi:MAG: c-type cytochrome [Burkholderiales bacterium]|nr:c-type cytochrome [Burkholderiales bacterium]MDE1929138.1 c-type cytochrome [Burkholderiales bacterium]MDE2157501.1 c-type cytochrome [Burkholderiales bacterium]MDE2503153.1 c-type cytochrome [Burkholderiales bacterium]
MNRMIGIALALAAAGPAGAQTSAPSAAAAAAAPSAPLYTVVDGYKVDPGTLQGFRTWRQAACDRCHGPNQEGLVGPSLIDSLKVLTKDQFVATVRDGRIEKGMPPWGTNKHVMDNIDHLYAYLKGRSDGKITKAHVQPMDAPSASK